MRYGDAEAALGVPVAGGVALGEEVGVGDVAVGLGLVLGDVVGDAVGEEVALGLVVGLTVTDGETLGVAVGRFAGSTNCSTAWPLSAAFMNAVQIRAG